MSQGYIVRVQNFSNHRRGGASYVVEGTGFGGINSQYRLGKVAKKMAHVFGSRSTARRYATRLRGEVVSI